MVQIHLGPHKLSSVVKMQDAERRLVSASVGAILCTDRPSRCPHGSSQVHQRGSECHGRLQSPQSVLVYRLAPVTHRDIETVRHGRAAGGRSAGGTKRH
ncbi:MAG: hypothetical protein QOH48_2485 [Actinomycetota bacterium]|nr:hypothetical protein [Actinomycetota bacterium]